MPYVQRGKFFLEDGRRGRRENVQCAGREACQRVNKEESSPTIESIYEEKLTN